jgi:predicted metalloprotease
MEWEGREESENVEDRRGMGRKAGMAVAGGGGLLVVIVALLLGVDPQKLLQQMPQQQAQQGQPAGVNAPPDPAQEPLRRFTAVVLRDTEVVWDEQFRKMGKHYEKPVLVLFSGQVESACGIAGAAVGPFYCPGDHRVYIDLSFYREMEKKLGAPGEFARAYVIAHEVGHHVQNLLGYSKKAHDAQRGQSPVQQKHISVRLELQADYLAGVWAHYAKDSYKLNRADLESAINAAHQIGDDHLQQQAQGYVRPDSFTHGTSQQRMKWLMKGFTTGDVQGARELFELRYDEL